MIEPEAEKLKQDWQEEDEHLINSAIDALLKAQNGRRMLWWLLEIGRVGGQPFTGNALQTSFNCGELNIGQQILAKITEVSPDGYMEMMKEQQDVRRTRDRALGDAYRAGDGTGEDA